MTVATALGVLFMTVGRAGTADATSKAAQVRWLGASTTGLVVGVGAGLVLLAVGRARVSVRRRHLLSILSATAQDPGRNRQAGFALVTVENGTWIHRADCPLVAGKAVRPSRSVAAIGVDCPVCSGQS